jgi:hypothetical protein
MSKTRQQCGHQMQSLRILLAAIFVILGSSQTARADCRIIDQLDKLFILQTRLAANPNTALFGNDIRQLRAISSSLSERAALQAIDGNTLLGKGAEVVRFLRNTRLLLDGASLDDPSSVLSHYTRGNRNNLAQIGDHLHDLRCTDEQISVAQAEAASDPIRSTSDAEDIAAVSAALSQAIQELTRPSSILVILLAIATTVVASRLISRWLVLRRRRTKRHNTNFATRYYVNEQSTKGVLLDINCFGTKLKHADDAPIPGGTSIAVDIGDQMTKGTVMWSNQHYSGVQFKSAISLGQVEHIRASVIG